MPDRPGDIPIEERVNAGDVDLTFFFPGGDSLDAHTAITSRSPYRARVRDGVHTRRPHQSTRRDNAYAGSLELPEYVVSSRIEIDGKYWGYRTTTDLADATGIRRVFIEIDQALELDIDETLKWLSVNPILEIGGPPSIDDIGGLNDRKREIDFMRAMGDYEERKRMHDVAQETYKGILQKLNEEASLDNANNQVIMQLMHERIIRGEPMLPNSIKVHRTIRGTS